MKLITGKRITLLAAALLLGVSVVHVFGQGRKKAPVKVAATGQLDKYDSTRYHYFLFPQFYSYWPIDNNDTILKYECFDGSGNYINVDTLYNINDVQHISFVKSYTDYTQTSIDAEGKPRPKTVMKYLYKYDRTGPDSWTGYDEINHYTTVLKENRNDITRTDTTAITDPITGTRQITIRKYFRILEMDSAGGAPATETIPTEQTTDNVQKTAAVTYNYTVPEFYFYLPKKINDTTLEFLCYDSRDSLMPAVNNYDSVRYYSLFKRYIDSAHTYKDSNGDKKPLPVSTIIKRYDHIAKDRWMTIEYPKNKYQELTEYKNIIVSTDTVAVVDAVNDKIILKIFSHYKLVK